jgi:purine-binding chemotaxis protein CheW
VIKELLLKKALGKTEDDNKVYKKFILCKIHELPLLIKIDEIKEIVNLTNLTPVPGIEKNILGVLNLRGLVVPVIDIRIKFNIDIVTKTPFSRYVVVEINKELIAILVDEAQSIIEVEENNHADTNNTHDYFNDYINYNNDIIGILDLKKIFLDYKI